MTIAFRSSANVTNGTAGTSVVVNKPAGTTNGDMLIAFIAEAGTGSITKPAGWTLIGSAAASTNVTLACYWKLAASEGASWTWTLGASVRNWGYVAAYTGVDSTSPIGNSGSNTYTASGTDFGGPAKTISGDAGNYSWCLSAVASTRAAGGSATSWLEFNGTERADLSTNAGAGTDIAGAVSDTSFGSFDLFTASQSQSQAAAWTVILQPAFASYDSSRPVVPKVEAAFGADPDGDPTGWTWTDISSRVLRNPGVSISKGRGDWTGEGNPTRIALAVLNTDGALTPDNPNSTYYPNVVRNLPLRVSVPVGYGNPTERATAFVSSYQPRWDASTRAAVVDIVADGRLRRLRQGNEPLHSPLYRSISGTARGTSAIAPLAYWPCEDGSGATSVASAIAGVAPLSIAGTVSFGGDSTLGGSAALISHGATWRMNGAVPAYTATGQWCALFAAKMPSAFTTGDFWLLRIFTDGTAPEWRVAVVPGAPDTVNIKAFNTSGTQVLSANASMDESTFYGNWWLFSIGVKQNGANIDYVLWANNVATGFGTTGTLNSFTHGNVKGIADQNDNGIDGVGFGHVAIFTDASFDNNLDPIWISEALDGKTGEIAVDRFSRLCIEEGIDYTSNTAITESSIGMGAQPVATLATIVQQCADVDTGLIHDGGSLGALTFTSRSSRYNAAATLTLDGHAGGIAVGFAPAYDDQALRNDVTVKADGASSARYVNTAHVAAEGRYTDQPTLNLGDGSHCYEIAGWRVGLGTQPGVRVPQLGFSLRRNSSLAAGWLASRIGSRVSGTNLPTTFGPSSATVDAFIEGYTEVLAEDWSVTLNVSPARPYDVIALNGSANTSRLDTSGSTLASGVTSSGTSLSVATASGALWSTASGDRPFDIEIAGERLTVTNVTGSSSPQTFTVTRSVNAVTKSQSSGAAVKLWHPSVIAL